MNFIYLLEPSLALAPAKRAHPINKILWQKILFDERWQLQNSVSFVFYEISPFFDKEIEKEIDFFFLKCKSNYFFYFFIQ
jgi:hypothetical protein